MLQSRLLLSYLNSGCNKFRPLWRHFVVDIDFMLFVVDLSDLDRFVEAQEELCQIAGKFKSKDGPGRVFVLINKQDLLEREEREKRVEEFKKSIMKSMASAFGDKLCVEVLDTPGLSTRSGKGLNNVMMRIKRELSGGLNEREEQFVNGEKPAPVPAPPSREQLVERVREYSAVTEPDDDVFWETFLSAKILNWDHYTHLRAGYFILTQQLHKGNDVSAATEDFLKHLERLQTQRPDKFNNRAHRTMTTFWLIQLERAGREFSDAGCGGRGLLERKSFQGVMMEHPELVNGGLWKEYYSKELMFSQEARSGWKEPDLRSLTGKGLAEDDKTLRGEEPEMSEKSMKS